VRSIALAAVLAGSLGCVSDLAIQGDSRVQVWLSELSQVKVRAAQSRVLDRVDKRDVLSAVVYAMQDLSFQVAVLDEELGIVSGKLFVVEEEPAIYDPFYVLYDDESLAAFSKTYRTWGPFRHRSDLVRLTVTVRRRNEGQLVVRASAQHRLRPIEDPLPYQKFFRTLETALFLDQEMSEAEPEPAPASEPEPEAELQADPEPDPEPEPEAEPDPEPELAPDSDPEQDPEPDPDPPVAP
jgi:hypothetical protein